MTTEADWRAFVALKARAFDRHVEATLAGVADLARADRDGGPGDGPDDDREPAERLEALRAYLAERDRIERACFDGHSRSRMPWQLLAMLAEGLVTEPELEPFGEGLRATVSPRRPAPDDPSAEQPAQQPG